MATAKKTAGNSDEVARKAQILTTEELASLSTFEEALALLQGKIGEENIKLASEEIGDGFKMLDNKDQLIEVPFLAVSWDFHQGEHGEFVAVKLMTKKGDKYILIDGSTGIRDQLIGYTNKTALQAGLFCVKGLRRSDYEYEDEGEMKKARTYYLDTSA